MFYGNESFKELLSVQLQHTTGNDCLEDVWDGRVWKLFKCDNRGVEKCFFSDLYHVALILNIDWFKPFKHSEYKVGGIYMNVLNLPRTERYKTKWTMLIGLIPGPTEPKNNINSYLKPLVDDLNELWSGVLLETNGNMMRAALIAVSCDLPAARKVSQFLGHKANKGCSRCEFEAQRENGNVTGRMSYFTTKEVIHRVNNNV